MFYLNNFWLVNYNLITITNVLTDDGALMKSQFHNQSIRDWHDLYFCCSNLLHKNSEEAKRQEMLQSGEVGE